MEKQQPVENKMGVEPIRSLVLKMSFPMMVSMLMQAMYNIVDSIFVSRISETPSPPYPWYSPIKC